MKTHFLKRESLFFISFLFVLLYTSCTSHPGEITNDKTKMESEIKEIEQQWAETTVTGDTTVIKKILAEDFLGVDPFGGKYTRQDLIDLIRKEPFAFKSNVVNDIKIRFYNNIAVAQGSETFQKNNGENGRFVWTDVLVPHNGSWQVVAAEDMILPIAQEPATK